MKKIFFILLLVVNFTSAQGQYDFAIYHDNEVGAWEDGIIAFEQFLNWKNISHNRVTAQDINTIVLKDFYKAIYFPGGDADYYNADINSSGIQHIQNLISDNGAYIGMCAGAEFACDKLVWQGITYDYPLNLFEGEAVGPIDDIAVWPDYAMTTVSMNIDDEINQFEPETEDMLYWGGCVYTPYINTEFDTIATFNAYYNKLAIVKFTYGNGRVLLISPHPEIEEDSDRDNTDVAQELNDNGSDWNFLWTATDWLLGNPISDPNNAIINSYSDNKNIYIYPNPANSSINISTNNKVKTITVYNGTGQKLRIKEHKNNSVDLSGFHNGMYIIEFIINDKIYRKKFIIEK